MKIEKTSDYPHLHIDNNGRGASIEYSRDLRYWHPIMHFDDYEAALTGWERFEPAATGKDTRVDHYRISCHENDCIDESSNWPVQHLSQFI